MAKRFRTAFAQNGDRTAIQDDAQVNGLLNYEQGYTASYSLDVGSDPDARRINRNRFNQVVFDMTENIKEWQEQLYPDYITPASNGNVPFSYSQGMVVNFNGVNRVSLVDTNTEDPSNDTNWANQNLLPVALGGTGAGTIADARANLEAAAEDHTHTTLPANVLIERENTSTEGGQFVMESSLLGTLNGNIAIDINLDSLRIFETGGNTRGVFIPFQDQEAGAASELVTSSTIRRNLYQPTVAGHVRSGNKQLTDGSVTLSPFAVTTNVPVGQFRSVGRDGSGASAAWPQMNIAPSNATSLIVDVLIRGTNVPPDSTGISLFATQGDITASFINTNRNRIAIANSNGTEISTTYTRVEIPLGPTNGRFNIAWGEVVPGSTVIQLHYRGFITD